MTYDMAPAIPFLEAVASLAPTPVSGPVTHPRVILSLRFTHFFRRFVETENQNPLAFRMYDVVLLLGVTLASAASASIGINHHQ